MAIQTYFKGLVLMRRAREECDRRRELKIARKMLRDQRAYQDRIRREAEEKLVLCSLLLEVGTLLSSAFASSVATLVPS